MPFRFAERDMTTLTDLLTFLPADQSALVVSASDGPVNPPVWYRGMGTGNDDLVPSFHRPWRRDRRRRFQARHEIHMMNLFKQNAHEFVLNLMPSSEWEWMFLMRHHGLPRACWIGQKALWLGCSLLLMV